MGFLFQDPEFYKQMFLDFLKLLNHDSELAITVNSLNFQLFTLF